MGEILIAYYSRRGQNYVNGVICDLEIGNTEFLARRLAKLTGGTLFRIDTVRPYPADYYETAKQAMTELQTGLRPELTGTAGAMERFDTVIFGYPNWWGSMPMAVHTFLEQHDFSGKRIIPFCTHEGGGAGRSEKDIQRLCPLAECLSCESVKGSAVRSADYFLNKIINKLKKEE